MYPRMLPCTFRMSCGQAGDHYICWEEERFASPNEEFFGVRKADASMMVQQTELLAVGKKWTWPLMCQCPRPPNHIRTKLRITCYLGVQSFSYFGLVGTVGCNFAQRRIPNHIPSLSFKALGSIASSESDVNLFHWRSLLDQPWRMCCHEKRDDLIHKVKSQIIMGLCEDIISLADYIW